MTHLHENEEWLSLKYNNNLKPPMPKPKIIIREPKKRGRKISTKRVCSHVRHRHRDAEKRLPNQVVEKSEMWFYECPHTGKKIFFCKFCKDLYRGAHQLRRYKND